MKQPALIPNLFRNEYSKIVAVLCKTYGLYNIQLAEDIVSDSFLKAAETWKIKGIPENPTAWLYTVSKNNAKDYFKRNDIFKNKVSPAIQNSSTSFEELEIDLSANSIKDGQLKMLFAICNPINTNTSQVALALKVLCGFGIEEISNALLTSKDTINKRLFRAKEKIRSERIELVFPAASELESRLDNVLSILYLLFNEGYYSTTAEKTISKELCIEAMRLLHILLKNPKTNLPTANALMALFCFHASRFEARLDQQGEQVLFEKQDKKSWDNELIQKGEDFLHHSAIGHQVSKYHLEAVIAYWHTRKNCDHSEKWNSILQLYNRLLQFEYSPVTALSRTFALAKAKGKEAALAEALKIKLAEHHLYHSLLGYLYSDINKEKEIEHLEIALSLCKNPTDVSLLQSKLDTAKSK